MAVVHLNTGEKRKTRDSRRLVCSSFTEDELEVAEIVLQLPRLILLNLDSGFLPIWGAKKRRSAIDLSPSSSPLVHRCNGEKTHDVDVEASSPTTPLSFSPSEETDSKSKQSRRRVFKKKTNKELKDMVAKLSAQQEQLKQEIAKVREYFEGLESENLKLNEIKLELGLLQDKNQLELSSCRNMNVLVEQIGKPSPALEKEQHQEPLIYHPSMTSIKSVTLGSEIAENFQYPYDQTSHPLSSGVVDLKTENQLNPLGIPDLNRDTHLSPLGIPDLNFSAEEAPTTSGLNYVVNHQAFDLSRAAIAAQARKRRIEMNRMKNNSMAIKPRFR